MNSAIYDLPGAGIYPDAGSGMNVPPLPIPGLYGDAGPSDPFGGIGNDVPDPSSDLSESHKRLLDAYDRLDKISQDRIKALEQMTGLKAPQQRPLKISPLQYILAALGSGIAGSLSKDPRVAEDAMLGFVNSSGQINDVKNRNAQSAYEDQVNAAKLRAQIAGEQQNLAERGVERAYREDQTSNAADDRRKNQILAMAGRLEQTYGPKLTSANAGDYYRRLNKMYAAAGQTGLVMSGQEIQAAVDALSAREAAAKDQKAKDDNEKIADRLVSAALNNPSTGRAKQALTIAANYYEPGSAKQREVLDKAKNLAPSQAEIGLLTRDERERLNQQLKTVRRTLDSLAKDLRGTANQDPAKMEAYVQALEAEKRLSDTLLAPQQAEQPQPPQAGGLQVTGTSGQAPPADLKITLPTPGNLQGPIGSGGSALVPSPSAQARNAAKGPAGKQQEKDLGEARRNLVKLKMVSIPDAQSALDAAIAEKAAIQRKWQPWQSLGANPDMGAVDAKVAKAQRKLDDLKGQQQRWMQRAEQIKPGSMGGSAAAPVTASKPPSGPDKVSPLEFEAEIRRASIKMRKYQNDPVAVAAIKQKFKEKTGRAYPG